MSRLATKSNPTSLLPEDLLVELERRRPGMARHMARAVVTQIAWDDSTGAPPQAAAIARACEAGLDLFLGTAREARPATQRELRELAQLGILQARGSQSIEPVLAAYRIAAKVAWDGILKAWRGHPEGSSAESMVVTANYVFNALDQVSVEVTRTYLRAREQHLHRGTRARARLFHALVSDTFDSELALQKQALGVNFALAGDYVALVVKSEESVVEVVASLELPARALPEATDPHTLTVLWPNEGQDRKVGDAVTDFLIDLRQRLKGKIRAGLGGEHSGLRGISRSYLEAQQAVEVGRKLRPDAVLHQHDELAPYLVLIQNPLVAERYVGHVLGRLLRGDPKGTLLSTLEAYLTQPSIKEAAAQLHLHRHTVLYRLEKLKELLGPDLDLPAERVKLQMAIDLRRLLA